MGQPHHPTPGRGTGGVSSLSSPEGLCPCELEHRGGTGSRWGCWRLPGVWAMGEGLGRRRERVGVPGVGWTLTVDTDAVSLARPGSMGGMLALPAGQGPHQVGCTDVMVGHTRQVRSRGRASEWGQGQASMQSRVAAASWFRTRPPPSVVSPLCPPSLSPSGALLSPLLPLPAPGRGHGAALDPALRVLWGSG